MHFFRAKLYRFFDRVRPHFAHGLPLPGPEASPPLFAGRSCWPNPAGDLVQRTGRHALRRWISSGGRLLLPLWDVEGAQRMRQDLRDAEICFALVGDILRAASPQGAGGQSRSQPAVASPGQGGTRQAVAKA